MLSSYQFGAVSDLLHDSVLLVVLIHDRVTIIPLEVAGNYSNWAHVIFCQDVQPLKKIVSTMLTLKFLKSKWSIIIVSFEQ